MGRIPTDCRLNKVSSRQGLPAVASVAGVVSVGGSGRLRGHSRRWNSKFQPFMLSQCFHTFTVHSTLPITRLHSSSSNRTYGARPRSCVAAAAATAATTPVDAAATAAPAGGPGRAAALSSRWKGLCGCVPCDSSIGRGGSCGRGDRDHCTHPGHLQGVASAYQRPQDGNGRAGHVSIQPLGCVGAICPAVLVSSSTAKRLITDALSTCTPYDRRPEEQYRMSHHLAFYQREYERCAAGWPRRDAQKRRARCAAPNAAAAHCCSLAAGKPCSTTNHPPQTTGLKRHSGKQSLRFSVTGSSHTCGRCARLRGFRTHCSSSSNCVRQSPC